MVSNDVVVKNEVMNDGGSIHVYYSEQYREFVAYGFSAFQAMKALKKYSVELRQEYSTEFQMPMVIVSKNQLEAIVHEGETLQGDEKGQYYHIQSAIMMNEGAYDEWAEHLRG
jgi:hypothetical protein